MPSKIEISLNQEQLVEFLKRCAQLKGAKLRDIQALAEEFGIDVSLMAARSFKQTAFQDYLDELKAKREMAESVAELAKNGVGLSDGAASVFAQKVFDAALQVDPADIGGKAANNISLAIARLRSGDQRAQLLEAQLREIERRETEWEEKRAAVTAQLERAKNATTEDADAIRANVVDTIDSIMGLKK